jgi:alkylresorcinol/alkylpyrone synthase
MIDLAPRIAAVTTALPPHRLTQAEAKAGAREVFADLPDLERLLRLFDRSGVETRYLVRPREYYLESRPFEERNQDYVTAALTLGEEAIRQGLDAAGIAPAEVDLLLFATTTGLATPSVDALLCERMGFRPEVRRLPIFGLGCAGGAGGTALAADLLRTRPRGVAVVLAVEACSLTLLKEEPTRVNLVGSALFADGAGCAVLTGPERGGDGPAVLASETFLFPESRHFMGWRFDANGFGLVLSPHVPGFIAEMLPAPVHAFLGRHDLTPESIAHFALHPGGRQVLEAYRRGLGLDAEALAPTRQALRDHGNLSSASVFFSLRRMLDDRAPRNGDRGFMAAMGPGFAAEMLLLGW